MIDDVYIKSKFKRKTMSRVPSSDTNAKGRINRKINIDRIRCSMQNFNIIKQNKVMVENRLMQKKNNEDELEQQRSSSPDSEIIHSLNFRVEIFDEKFQLLEKLGQGASGVVHRCIRRQDGREFAVKSFKFQDEHLPGLKANFLVMKNLRHPYIISYEALYFNLKKHIAWLVMELVKAPSLNVVTLTTEDEIKRVMWQVLDALSYLHNHDIVHRDIKPENILYDPETKKIKIIDFGISKRFRRRGALFDMWTITGTLYYRAPEMFSGGYREGIDVWAAGVLLYWLVCGHTPFESVYHSYTIQNIVKAELYFPPIFEKYSQELKSLITDLLNKNPQYRIVACFCLRNSWFSDISLHYKSDKSQKTSPGNSPYLNLTSENHPSKVSCPHRLKSIISLQDYEEDNGFLKMPRALTAGHPQVRRLHDGDFHVIDEQWS